MQDSQYASFMAASICQKRAILIKSAIQKIKLLQREKCSLIRWFPGNQCNSYLEVAIYKERIKLQNRANRPTLHTRIFFSSICRREISSKPN